MERSKKNHLRRKGQFTCRWISTITDMQGSVASLPREVVTRVKMFQSSSIGPISTKGGPSHQYCQSLTYDRNELQGTHRSCWHWEVLYNNGILCFQGNIHVPVQLWRDTQHTEGSQMEEQCILPRGSESLKSVPRVKTLMRMRIPERGSCLSKGSEM